MKLSVIHIVCVALIVACYTLAFTLLKDNDEASTVLCGAATFLWGKLGFKPAKALLEKIIQSMDAEEVVAIKSMVPPQSPAATRLSIVPAANVMPEPPEAG
jgi:hypothetical protein